MDKVIGIDIGGTTINGVRVRNQRQVGQADRKTRADRPLGEILDTLKSLITELMEPETSGIGIGIPGILDLAEGRVVSINNIPSFEGLAIKSILEEEFGLPVKINNDANCFALGEAIFGAGKPFRNLVGITLGTGVGGGLIIDGKIYSGNHAAAGEFGLLNYRGDQFEAYGGSSYFEREYYKPAHWFYEQAQKGDRDAKQVFLNYGEHLFEGLKSAIYILAPEAIILGGSISKAFEFFSPALEQKLASFPYPALTENMQILPAELEHAGALGAAALLLEDSGK